MACGDKVEISVTEWGVCWWAIFPYPCKKTSTKTRYHYEFNPYRTRFAFFTKKYEGCCGLRLYEWTEGFALFGTGNGAWIHQLLEKNLSSPAAAKGDCPFNTGPVFE